MSKTIRINSIEDIFKESKLKAIVTYENKMLRPESIKVMINDEKDEPKIPGYVEKVLRNKFGYGTFISHPRDKDNNIEIIYKPLEKVDLSLHVPGFTPYNG